MNKIFLITRPDYDPATRYLSLWSNKIIEIANKKGIPVLDLRKNKANKKELESRINKMKPSLIMFNGHGSSSCISGYDNEVLVETNSNEEILKDRIIYAVSCQSAEELGPKSIQAGTLTYIGYNGDFIFCHDINKISCPLDDKIAKIFLEPSNQVIISLLKGNESKKASENSKKYFMRNMQKLLTSDTSVEHAQYVKYLWWDMKCQVCLGDGNSNF